MLRRWRPASEPRLCFAGRHAQGGRCEALAINPQTAGRIHAYLDKAGHAGDSEGPLFRPLRYNRKRCEARRRRMNRDPIDRAVRKYAAALGPDRG